MESQLGKGPVARQHVVVGAGLNGCLAARWLAHRGRRVTVIDAANVVGGNLDATTAHWSATVESEEKDPSRGHAPLDEWVPAGEWSQGASPLLHLVSFKKGKRRTWTSGRCLKKWVEPCQRLLRWWLHTRLPWSSVVHEWKDELEHAGEVLHVWAMALFACGYGINDYMTAHDVLTVAGLIGVPLPEKRCALFPERLPEPGGMAPRSHVCRILLDHENISVRLRSVVVGPVLDSDNHGEREDEGERGEPGEREGEGNSKRVVGVRVRPATAEEADTEPGNHPPRTGGKATEMVEGQPIFCTHGYVAWRGRGGHPAEQSRPGGPDAPLLQAGIIGESARARKPGHVVFTVNVSELRHDVLEEWSALPCDARVPLMAWPVDGSYVWIQRHPTTYHHVLVVTQGSVPLSLLSAPAIDARRTAFLRSGGGDCDEAELLRRVGVFCENWGRRRSLFAALPWYTECASTWAAAQYARSGDVWTAALRSRHMRARMAAVDAALKQQIETTTSTSTSTTSTTTLTTT